MKVLKTEKKTESPSYIRTKSVRDSVGYRHKTETDFVGSGYHPPERFVPLLAKLSHPPNATQRIQLFNQLQTHYGNRYVQRVVSAYRSQNVEEDDNKKLASEIISKKGSGRPLEPEVREFMEPRFGYDFSNARIHTDSFAARAAQDLGAEAFTIGRDVFFGAGRYNHWSTEGKRLIAHELTHVVQQGDSYTSQKKSEALEREADTEAMSVLSAVIPKLQRPSQGLKKVPKGEGLQKRIQLWSYGAAPSPDPNYQVVPANHRRRVEAAMNIISRVVNTSRQCQTYFENWCSSGAGANAIFNAFNNLTLWYYATENFSGESINGTSHVAYTAFAYRMGSWTLASTILHEMFHTCDPVIDPTDEPRAEEATEACRVYTPFAESVTPGRGGIGDVITIEGWGFGPSQGPADRVEFNGVDAGRALIWQYTPGGTGLIRVRVPNGATSGPLIVINNRVRSNAINFTVA